MAKVGGNDHNDWQMNCVDLKHRGTHLLHTGLWSDCAFRVRDEVIKAHKLMLAMASSVFAAMLYGGLYESSTGPIHIEDIAPEVFRALLEYIYTDSFGEISCDIACGLYYAAHKYMMPQLVKQCSTYIASNISVENVCQAYELANVFDDRFLMDKCLQFISSNTKQVLNDSSFMEIQLNTLLKLFSMDILAIDSELDLVNALARYKQNYEATTPSASTLQDEVSVPASTSSNTTRTAHDVTDKLTIRHVTAQIRFLSLTPQQFADCASVTSLLTDQERLVIFMKISSSICNDPMPDGFSISRYPRNINESSAETVYCTREYTPSPSTSYTVSLTNKTRCMVSFTVDQPVALLKVQVASQMLVTRGGCDTYRENIRVQLCELKEQKTTIAEVSFNAVVKYNDFMDIKFETPVVLQVGQEYWIGIFFKSHGQYPRGVCSTTVSGCDGDAAEETLQITDVYFAHDLLRSIVILKPNTGTLNVRLASKRSKISWCLNVLPKKPKKCN